MFTKVLSESYFPRLRSISPTSRSYCKLKYSCFKLFKRSGSSSPLKDDTQLKSKVEKLLSDASPLKSNIRDENDWATTPYPEGTFFSKNRQAKLSLRPKCNPKDTSILLFPGQGTQFVGMGRGLMAYPVVKDMYGAASEILGYDLLKLCLEGPEEKLNKTEYCQPAVFVTSLAAIEKLKEENPEAVNGCIATAGFSIGELSALVFAGCFSFERGVKLVKVRAEAMQLCSEMVPSGMITILFGADSELGQVCIDAKNHCKSIGIEHPVCSIANYLAPGIKVLAGHNEALNFIVEKGEKYKIRKISRLPVSGAFHTELMKPAAIPFRNALKKFPINEPIIPVHSNVDGRRYMTIDHVEQKLPKQIFSAVKWEQILHILYSRTPGEDFPNTFECGPGRSLKTILKKVNMRAYEECKNILP